MTIDDNKRKFENNYYKRTENYILCITVFLIHLTDTEIGQNVVLLILLLNQIIDITFVYM